VINACLGLAVGAAMYLIGVPNPVLWGVVAGTANYIPYLGAVVGAVVVGVVAFLSLDSASHALLAPISYMTLSAIEGQLITPTILGLRFSLNPVVIYVWLIFWGWMWGVVGAVLAVPLLTIFKIFCDRIPSLSPVGDFLEK
jgi:predicted PurR-regulated permease PerM